VLAVPEETHDIRTCSPSDQAAPGRSDCEIVVLPAEIDIANASLVSAGLLAAIGAGRPVIIADLSSCSFCDCAGVGALLGAAAVAVLQGAQLRLVATARPVLRVFELTGLDHSLPVYPTRSAARRDVARR
jgi:anti-sigma B factor antagonist